MQHTINPKPLNYPLFPQHNTPLNLWHVAVTFGFPYSTRQWENPAFLRSYAKILRPKGLIQCFRSPTPSGKFSLPPPTRWSVLSIAWWPWPYTSGISRNCGEKGMKESERGICFWAIPERERAWLEREIFTYSIKCFRFKVYTANNNI